MHGTGSFPPLPLHPAASTSLPCTFWRCHLHVVQLLGPNGGWRGPGHGAGVHMLVLQAAARGACTQRLPVRPQAAVCYYSLLLPCSLTSWSPISLERASNSCAKPMPLSNRDIAAVLWWCCPAGQAGLVLVLQHWVGGRVRADCNAAIRGHSRGHTRACVLRAAHIAVPCCVPACCKDLQQCRHTPAGGGHAARRCETAGAAAAGARSSSPQQLLVWRTANGQLAWAARRMRS